MVVKPCNGRYGVEVKLPGHAVQVGQPEMKAAHRQHARFEQVDVPVLVPRNLRRTDESLTFLIHFTRVNICIYIIVI